MNYSELVMKLLSGVGAQEGDTLDVRSNGRAYIGVLMPHHEFSDPDVIVIKMKSGYNIGVRLSPDTILNVVSKKEMREKPARHQGADSNLKTIAVVGTGGTIASYVDYRTGAVHPALSADDLVRAVPEISSVCNVRARVLFSIFSENMNAAAWSTIARAVKEELDAGVDGILIPHGTDTMGYTSAALAFMLEGLNRPVVLVGAQRSSDRPSSDSYTNLIAAAKFCVETDAAGVFVLMHDSISDTTAAVHQGTRVRKMHTSRRDAFKSVNSPPVAKIAFEGKIETSEDLACGRDGQLVLRNRLNDNVALLQFYPGMRPDVFKGVLKAHDGVVIAGSGLGHVSAEMVKTLAEAVREGVTVVMTSQCLCGRVNLNVYATGRDLINAGVIPGEDMLPETALVKLMWVLGQTDDADEIRRLMAADLRGEISERREIDG